MKIASLLQTGAVAPDISEHGRREAKRYDIRDRVQLDAEIAGGFR